MVLRHAGSSTGNTGFRVAAGRGACPSVTSRPGAFGHSARRRPPGRRHEAVGPVSTGAEAHGARSAADARPDREHAATGRRLGGGRPRAHRRGRGPGFGLAARWARTRGRDGGRRPRVATSCGARGPQTRRPGRRGPGARTCGARRGAPRPGPRSRARRGPRGRGLGERRAAAARPRRALDRRQPTTARKRSSIALTWSGTSSPWKCPAPTVRPTHSCGQRSASAPRSAFGVPAST